jgi:hypothetical protein
MAARYADAPAWPTDEYKMAAARNAKVSSRTDESDTGTDLVFHRFRDRQREGQERGVLRCENFGYFDELFRSPYG